MDKVKAIKFCWILRSSDDLMTGSLSVVVLARKKPLLCYDMPNW